MSGPASDWTIVTVTYNNEDELKTWWVGADLQGASWIVVDNDSMDESADTAAALGANVVRLNENVGFSRANNLALAKAKTRYVAFVNPDVRLDALSLNQLGHIITKRNAIVSPQLVNPDGSVQPNGRGLPFLIDKFAHRGVMLPGSRVSEYLPDTSAAPTYVAWTMGAAICAEVEPLIRAGGWDEKYFLYYEDHAFGLEAWRRGQEVIVVPTAKWTHGWKRETRRFRIRPWLREFSSAWKFYRTYPVFLLPRTRNRHQWSELKKRSGAPVPM